MKYFKSFVLFLLCFIVLFFIFNSLSYFDIVGNNFIYLSNFIFFFISSFISGIYIGLNSLNKGYLEGIKVGGIIILFLFSISIFFTNKLFSIYLIVIYFLVVLFSIVGSIIGINKKKKV